MATVLNHPLPPAAVTRILCRFDRDQLAAFISVAIDLLDVADGDTDFELNGDERDGSLGEDDFHSPSAQWTMAAGCPISDPPEGDGDEQDGTGAEDDFMRHDASGPGCPVADPGGGSPDDEGEGDAPADERVLADQLHRIRKTRCYPEARRYRDWGGSERQDIVRYRLRNLPSTPTSNKLLKRKRGMPKRPRP